MKKLFNISKFLFFFSLLFFQNLFAQNFNIDYIGIISKDIDQNMAKMTSDLFLTQLNEIQELTVNDKRTEMALLDMPEKSSLSSTNLSFFTEIYKSEQNEKWIATIHIFNPDTDKENTKSTEYDSFYKILMESKHTLKDTVTDLLNNKAGSKYVAEKDVFAPQNITSTEALSGTWSGEEYIDRIIIMRGGRGFIIFNNGASMTISVSLKNEDNNTKVVILQNGHSNASFYPNLPRNIAVTAALEAEPLEWTFLLSDSDTLSGTKKTLTAKDESFDYVFEKVKWKRVR